MIRFLYRRRLFRTALVITMSLLLPAQDLLARGGGGRGGGGGGFRGGGGGGGFRGGGGGGGYRGGGGGGGYRGGGGGGRPMNPGASHSVARPGGGGGGMNRPGGGFGGGGMGGNRPPVGGGGGRGGIGGGNIGGGGGRGGIGGGGIGGGGRGGEGIGGGGRGGIGGGGRGGQGIGGGGRGGQGIGGGGRGGDGIGGRGGNNIGNRGGNNIGNRSGNNVNFNNNHFNNGAWGNHYGNYHGYNNYWHHGYWHGGWGYGGWGWGYGWGGLAAAGLLGWGLGSMYANSGYGGGYSNPYYETTTASAPYLDYSQPIQATAAPQTDATDAAAPSPEIAAALVPFDAARAAFKAGNYNEALTKVEEALQKLPNDAALHEFRGLVLFALARYKESASTVYAVLSAGPGWDWTTLSSMYPSVDVYTQQLRALEAFSRQNPESPDAAFVLAYHYLTCGYKEAAAKELQTVVRLLPNDQLAPRLLKMVSGDAAPPGTPPGPTITPQPPESAEEPTPQVPDAGPPVDKAKVIGAWKASSGTAVTIELTLKENGNFVWKVDQAGRSNSIEGTYTLEGSTLVLKQKSDGDSMNGKVTLNDKGGFNFKLLETGPGDPGLNFSK